MKRLSKVAGSLRNLSSGSSSQQQPTEPKNLKDSNNRKSSRKLVHGGQSMRGMDVQLSTTAMVNDSINDSSRTEGSSRRLLGGGVGGVVGGISSAASVAGGGHRRRGGTSTRRINSNDEEDDRSVISSRTISSTRSAPVARKIKRASMPPTLSQMPEAAPPPPPPTRGAGGPPSTRGKQARPPPSSGLLSSSAHSVGPIRGRPKGAPRSQSTRNATGGVAVSKKAPRSQSTRNATGTDAPQPTRKKVTRQRSSSLSSLKRTRRAQRKPVPAGQQQEQNVEGPAAMTKDGAAVSDDDPAAEMNNNKNEGAINGEEGPTKEKVISSNWVKSSSDAVERIEARKKQMEASKKKNKILLQQQKQQQQREAMDKEEEEEEKKEAAAAEQKSKQENEKKTPKPIIPPSQRKDADGKKTTTASHAPRRVASAPTTTTGAKKRHSIAVVAPNFAKSISAAVGEDLPTPLEEEEEEEEESNTTEEKKYDHQTKEETEKDQKLGEKNSEIDKELREEKTSLPPSAGSSTATNNIEPHQEEVSSLLQHTDSVISGETRTTAESDQPIDAATAVSKFFGDLDNPLLAASSEESEVVDKDDDDDDDSDAEEELESPTTTNDKPLSAAVGPEVDSGVETKSLEVEEETEEEVESEEEEEVELVEEVVEEEEESSSSEVEEEVEEESASEEEENELNLEQEKNTLVLEQMENSVADFDLAAGGEDDGKGSPREKRESKRWEKRGSLWEKQDEESKEEALSRMGRDVQPTKRRATRQRSRSLTSMGRLGTRGGRRPAVEVAEQEPPKPKPFRLFFDDEHTGETSVKLNSSVVEGEVNELQAKVRDLEKQLEDCKSLEQQQIEDERNKIPAVKEAFKQEMDGTADSVTPKADLSDAVGETRSVIAYLQKENANRRKDIKKLRLNLFDMHQKTVQLERLTETTLKWVQELEEVHLVHEVEKNDALHVNMRICREGRDKLLLQQERRERYLDMEKNVRSTYERTIDAIQVMFQEKCRDPDLVARITGAELPPAKPRSKRMSSIF